jgi:2-desacetyl-2-hydroxyethyl bacteriochlorophyllide A dehydrogenase
VRAAVYRGERSIAVEERPVPELGPRDALIEVSHCGICGTDLHVVLEGMGRPGSIGGHEYAGRVAALGAEVEGFRLGEAVVGGAFPGCGRCAACEAERPSLCRQRPAAGVDPFQGAFAEFVRVPGDQLVRLPEDLPLREAALAEPLAVALHAITLSRIESGSRALVSGSGPIGLLVVAALRAGGLDEIVASEPGAVRRARAAALGAESILPDDLVAPRMPFDIAEDPFDVAFECSGHPRAMEAALAQLRPGGTLVLVGTGMRRPKLDHNRILLNELLVTGAYGYDAGGFEDAVELLASGVLPTPLLVEPDDVPLEGLLGAMERLAAGELGGKVMTVPKEMP